MNLLMKFSVLGISLMLSVWACVHHDASNSARCDHAQPKTHVVKVILDRDTSKKPSVDKKSVVACFGDEIVFEAKKDANFAIRFKRGSVPGPFGKNLGSSRGRAAGKVNVNPKIKTEYEYDVVDTGVPGRPILDPRIIITPR